MAIKSLKCSSSRPPVLPSYVSTYRRQRKSSAVFVIGSYTRVRSMLILNQTSGLGLVLDRWYPALQQSNMIHAWMDAYISYKSTCLHFYGIFYGSLQALSLSFSRMKMKHFIPYKLLHHHALNAVFHTHLCISFAFSRWFTRCKLTRASQLSLNGTRGPRDHPEVPPEMLTSSSLSAAGAILPFWAGEASALPALGIILCTLCTVLLILFTIIHG